MNPPHHPNDVVVHVNTGTSTVGISSCSSSSSNSNQNINSHVLTNSYKMSTRTLSSCMHPSIYDSEHESEQVSSPTATLSFLSSSPTDVLLLYDHRRTRVPIIIVCRHCHNQTDLPVSFVRVSFCGYRYPLQLHKPHLFTDELQYFIAPVQSRNLSESPRRTINGLTVWSDPPCGLTLHTYTINHVKESISVCISEFWFAPQLDPYTKELRAAILHILQYTPIKNTRVNSILHHHDDVDTNDSVHLLL